MEMLLGYVVLMLAQLEVIKSYVVPTGSMAPTIRGVHKEVRCPQCKSRFPVNASSESWGGKLTGCVCANCQAPIDFAKDNVIPQPAGGDRIFAVATSASATQRGDIMVFRNPEFWFGARREDNRYVSRLMGMPGETLAIQSGRLYVATDLKYKDDKVKEEDLWRPAHMHIDDAEAIKRFQQGKFRIFRPSATQLLVQRRIVHDNDHRAAGLPSRWTGSKGSAWGKDGADGFQNPGNAAGVDWLTYRHLARTDKPGQTIPSLILDHLAYNDFKSADRHFPVASNWVGDLMLQAQVTIAKPEGELTFEVVRGGERFQARCELSAGRCALYRLAKGAQPVELATVKEPGLSKAGTFVVRFANFADRLTLWIDDKLPFGDGVPYDPSAQNGPTRDDLEPIRIGNQGASVKVRQLQIWRNIYYTQKAPFPDADPFDPTDPEAWGPLRKPPVRTFYVQPGHFFFMGDNPSAASDSRDWGVVPAQLLAGRALLRYYPFDRAGPIR